MQNLDLRKRASGRSQIAATGMTLQLAAKTSQSMRSHVPVIGTPRMRGPRQVRGFTRAQGLLDGLYQPARVG